NQPCVDLQISCIDKVGVFASYPSWYVGLPFERSARDEHHRRCEETLSRGSVAKCRKAAVHAFIVLQRCAWDSYCARTFIRQERNLDVLLEVFLQYDPFHLIYLLITCTASRS